MAAFNKFNSFVVQLGSKTMNLTSDSLFIMETNTAPVATNTVYANLVDLTTGNGYTAGGTVVGSTSWTGSSGIATLSGSNVVFTASGGTIGPFRYSVIYDETASGGPLAGWWDYGASVTLNSGDTFTINLSSNIATLQ